MDDLRCFPLVGGKRGEVRRERLEGESSNLLISTFQSLNSYLTNFARNNSSFCRVPSYSGWGKSGQRRVPYFLTGRVRQLADTASAAENNFLCWGFSEGPPSLKLRQVKMKMWGKSSHRSVATHCEGKPYGLKGHVYRGPVHTGYGDPPKSARGRPFESCREAWSR